MAVVLHPMARAFAREDTEPLLPGQVLPAMPPLPEGPRVPLSMQPPRMIPTPQQAASLSLPVAKRELQIKSPEVSQLVLWERPPKPAGWSAIWEVLPPPPPPPLDQDGVWIWVPEGEDIPVGAIVPHEALLPHADVNEELDAETEGSVQFGLDYLEQKLEQTTNAGFTAPSSFQAPATFPSSTEVWQPFPSELPKDLIGSVKGVGDAGQAWQPFPSTSGSGSVAELASQAQQPLTSQLPSGHSGPFAASGAVQVPTSSLHTPREVWQPFPSTASGPVDPQAGGRALLC
ncbi:FKBP9 [Symbiodinium pilosum]|uniref:FKBP9 protein n=1 Tax=Symbiodinium pilosum TaxID=2952 RepID=A0A812KAX7_SYMPI|nr:FKBP9 [Symbiodinium pilosum]